MSRSTRVSLLKNNHGKAQLQAFFAQFKTVSFETGDVLLKPDAPLEYIFYLEKGFVSQQVISENGEDFILNIYRPGSYLPMSLVLQEVKNEYSFEALTPIVAKKAPVSKVLPFLKENPEVLLELAVRLSIGVNSLAAKTEALIFGTAQRKIAATLYFTAQRFGKKQGKNIVIDFPLTHKRIATMTGITRETASIEMMKLKKQGILTYKGKRVTIFDMETLYNTCFCEIPDSEK